MLSDLLQKMTIALIMMLVSIPALLIIFIYNLVDYIKNIKDYEKREWSRIKRLGIFKQSKNIIEEQSS